MTSYIYELPTTGAISFSDFVIDITEGHPYTSCIAEATQARANMRGTLKQSRRADGEDRDYLRITKVLDDYIPHLRGIIACVQFDELQLKYEPVFSWRTTLSATLFNTSPRLRLPSLQADLASAILTYAMALSNFSHCVITSLGAYEYERAISEKARKEKDEKLNFGVTLLCRASGVFSAISESVLGELDKVGSGAGGWVRPPDLCKEVNVALAKMALADAQSLAIRKLLSKAAFESTLSPGPPLPKSHPSTALIAKLHLDCAALYSSARTLAMTPSKSSPTSRLKGSFGSSKSRGDGGGGSGEVSGDLLKYLESESKLHTAIAHKWLGVDAGETARSGKGGEAVGFLKWAQQELEDLHTTRLSMRLGIGRDTAKQGDQDGKRQDRRVRTEQELKSVQVFLEHYRKINDSLTFDPVPKPSELRTLIPEGRMAVTAKEYVFPDPTFGPGSKGYQMRTRARHEIRESKDETLGIEVLRIGNPANNSRLGTVDNDSSDDGSNVEETSRTYIGAGSYF